MRPVRRGLSAWIERQIDDDHIDAGCRERKQHDEDAQRHFQAAGCECEIAGPPAITHTRFRRREKKKPDEKCQVLHRAPRQHCPADEGRERQQKSHIKKAGQQAPRISPQDTDDAARQPEAGKMDQRSSLRRFRIRPFRHHRAEETRKRHAIGAKNHLMGVPLRGRHGIGERQAITADNHPQKRPNRAMQGGQRKKQPQGFGKDRRRPHLTRSLAENSSAKAGLSARRSASSNTARAMRPPGEPKGL
ncbi:hypothetical protein D3C71_1064780 [compost metagenome]